MKALSVKGKWARWIAGGDKTIETRRRRTGYRGELLICSTQDPATRRPGEALAVVQLVDCRPMTESDEAAAMCDLYPGAWAWCLADVRPVRRFPVRGMPGLFDVQPPDGGLVYHGLGKSEIENRKSAIEKGNDMDGETLTVDVGPATAAALAVVKLLEAKLEAWPNVIAPGRQPWQDGEKRLWVDHGTCRSMAQALIDSLDCHVHLREAQVCVLLRTGQKADADGLLEGGRARKCGPRDRVGFDAADFLIEVNADAWADRDGETEPERGRRRMALLDHELTHCAVTIAGSWVPPVALASFVEDLGKDHIETTEQTDDRGRTLVRYRKRRGPLKPGSDDYHDQPLAWRMRKHDVQDFTDVLGRWGPWESGVRRMYDVLVDVDWDGQLADWPASPLGQAAGKKAAKGKARRGRKAGGGNPGPPPGGVGEDAA